MEELVKGVVEVEVGVEVDVVGSSRYKEVEVDVVGRYKKVEMVMNVVMKVDVELWWCVNIPNNRRNVVNQQKQSGSFLRQRKQQLRRQQQLRVS